MPQYRIGKGQVEAVAELLTDTVDVQTKFTITGPREKDRAILVHIEEGKQRPEVSLYYIIGFSGLIVSVIGSESYPDPKEFYPHG